MNLDFKLIRSIFDKILLVFNVFFCLALLTSYLASVVSPITFWPIAVIGLFYRFLLFINVGLIIYWLIRRNIYCIIFLCVVLIGYSALVRNFGFNTAKPIVNKQHSIKVMTYNVHGFDNLNKTPSKQQIANLISHEMPDVLSIQEYCSKKGESGDVSNLLKKAMQSNHLYLKPFIITSYDTTGLAIFSKYPIISSGVVTSSTALELQAIYTDVK